MSDPKPAFLLKIKNGEDQYLTVAGFRVQDMSLSAEQVEVSGAGVFTGSAAEGRIKSNALTGALDDYRLSFESGETLSGRFLVTRLDYAGDYNGERSYAIHLKSEGKVVSA